MVGSGTHWGNDFVQRSGPTSETTACKHTQKFAIMLTRYYVMRKFTFSPGSCASKSGPFRSFKITPPRRGELILITTRTLHTRKRRPESIFYILLSVLPSIINPFEMQLPQLNLPQSDAVVNVSAINTTTNMVHPAKFFVEPIIPGHEL
jgi:hypothetical protein